MDDLLLAYLARLAASLHARQRGDEELENAILEELDDIWLKMSPVEILRADQIVKLYSDGVINLGDLDNLTAVFIQPRSVTSLLTLKRFYSPLRREPNDYSSEFVPARPIKGMLPPRTAQPVHPTSSVNLCHLATA